MKQSFDSFVKPIKDAGMKFAGNAIDSQVLAPATFYSTSKLKIVGTMPNRGTFNLAAGATVPLGYYSGGTVMGHIKSIQRGVTLMPSDGGGDNPQAFNVPITPITNYQKAIVRILAHTNSRGEPRTDEPAGSMSNNNEFLLQRASAYYSELTVVWEVIEFEANVTIQRGLIPLSTMSATISAVDLSKSFINFSGYKTGTNQVYGPPGAYLSNSTTVTCIGDTYNLRYDVVSLP